MIRRFYALPRDELGCQAVELLHFHLTPHGVQVETQPGTATLEGGRQVEATPGVIIRIGAAVVPGSFAPTPEVRQPSGHGRMIDPARFLAWFETHYQKDASDHHAQQLVSGALEYLWLQRAGLLPPAPEEE